MIKNKQRQASGERRTRRGAHDPLRAPELYINRQLSWLEFNRRVLEEALQRFAGCAVVVSHDRYFLDRIATHILVFEGDGKTDYLEGNYADYEDWKSKRGERATAAEAKGGAYRRLTR